MRKGRARFSKNDDSCFFRIDDKKEYLKKETLINALERTKNEGDIKSVLMRKKHGKYQFNFIFNDKDSVEVYNVLKEDKNFSRLKSMATINVNLLQKVGVITAIVASGVVFSITPVGKEIIIDTTQKFQTYVEYSSERSEFQADLELIRNYVAQLKGENALAVYDDLQDLLSKYNNQEMIEYLKISENDQKTLNYYEGKLEEFYEENKVNISRGMSY